MAVYANNYHKLLMGIITIIIMLMLHVSLERFSLLTSLSLSKVPLAIFPIIKAISLLPPILLAAIFLARKPLRDEDKLTLVKVG